jgi:hypothetical protein
MASSTPTVFPTVFDIHGRLLDPTSGAPLPDGQEAPGSIFHVPSSEAAAEPTIHTDLSGNLSTISFSKLMQQMRRQGFEGENVFWDVAPRPEDLERVPSPPPPLVDYSDADVETTYASFYCTQCAYCWAVVQGSERSRGFKLSEICQAAIKGCSTCNVLQHGITKFADLLFPKYSNEKVRIRQGENGISKLLSETKAVTVCFDEYGGETIGLTFNGSSRYFKFRKIFGGVKIPRYLILD